MHHPTDRTAHTTAFVTPVVEHWLEREIDQWVHCSFDLSCPILEKIYTFIENVYVVLLCLIK